MAAEPPNPSFVQRLLTRLADAVYFHPRAFFYPQIVLFLVCLLGPLGEIADVQPPDDALDALLRADPGHVVALQGLNDAFDAVVAVLPVEHRALLLALEEAQNEVAGRSADVGYRRGIGLRVESLRS